MAEEDHMKKIILFLLMTSLFYPFAHALDDDPSCSSQSGQLARPFEQIGSPDPQIPIEHIIVMMQENHSFNNVLGKLSSPEFYGDDIDGIKEEHFNRDSKGSEIKPFHLVNLCTKDMGHSWDAMHTTWNEGQNDLFIVANETAKKSGARVMGYYDQNDYPLMYFLADKFSVADRYFSSVLGPTHPNRLYMYSATSAGKINNSFPNILAGGYKHKTIFEALNEAHVSWSYYHADYSNVFLFSKMVSKNLKHFKRLSKFDNDAKAGNLAQVVFVENSTILGEEHPPSNFQFNQRVIRKNLQALIDGPLWGSSAVFISYDESGGSWDHVAPPKACAPDGILPIKGKKDKIDGQFDRLGFRVPAIVISPWAKKHFVSHVNYDHTSILKFIEVKFNIPALTNRDANADPMMDMFDFKTMPDFSWFELPKVKIDWNKAIKCIVGKKI